MVGAIFGGGKSQANQQPAASGLQFQTSAYGKAIPIVYGTTRIAPNLIDYTDFLAVAQQSSSGAGGKGGVGGGGGGKGGGGSVNYLYFAAVALGLCEGPIQWIGNAYVNKNVVSPASLGFTTFLGTYPQTPWGYLSTNHPEQALGYNGTAYLAASAYQLGNSPQLPNHNFEVHGIGGGNSIAGIVDCDPSLVVHDLLTNPHYGAGFPSGRVGNLSVYQAYTIASGLWISPAYVQQAAAAQMIDEIATNTNSAFVWSAGVLTLVPHGDASITANGYTYTAPSVPVYDLTDDDFVSPSGEDPVKMTRSRQADSMNSVQLEYLDRANQYNTAVAEAKDQASIDVFGLRQAPSSQSHLFADATAARLSAQLQLQRQALQNTYEFTLDQRYVLLDPMDIVTLTDPALGLNRQWVRITEISEDDNGLLTFTAEEYLNGTGSAPAYSFQSGQGYAANYNASPGNANAPAAFEPPAQLAEALEVWLATSGGPLWGGCDIWLSNDDSSYKLVGRVTGSARTGSLTAAIPSVTAASTGQTIDALDTLSVSLAESGGQLLPGTQADAIALNTLCYADGELLAYQTANLTGPNAYDLGYLVRGAYGSGISAHSAGSRFARLDGGIFKIPFAANQIGQTVYLKIAGFNIYGGGEQQLADINPYAYTLKGAAFSSPLPDVTNLRTSYVAAITQLTWDEITDFRPVLYEIRKGAAPQGGQVLGRVAHPPFNAQGDGTYWVAAYSQPAAGIQVYSNWTQIAVSGAQIVSNVIATYDEAATGWTGTLGGSAALIDGIVRTGGAGDILTLADYLNTPDILNYGGEGNGTYEIPVSHQIDIGRVAPCSVLITWSAVGQHTNADILTVPDILNFPDILDYEASANVDVYPEIALSQDGVTFGPWQKYAAGFYQAQKYTARMQLLTYDPNVEAILQGFTFAVDVPDRDDHYVNLTIPAPGLNLSFTPDGTATPKPFNGGPQGSPDLPAVQVTLLNAQAGDDVVVSSLTLSGCTLQVLNGGVGVPRNGSILAQGY
ncbi:MAG: phage tail protein [Planctomycetes bacterium]|nr:phage tail protein [Planctomycetota bacterium]